MSKKYYPSHSNGTTGKVIATALAVAILAGGVCCTGYASRNDNGKWFSNPNIASWHWSDKTANNPNAPDGLVNVTEEKGINLMTARIAAADYEQYGIEAQANMAYTITATVNADAVDKSVVGGITWKNASSSWASGKTLSDYVVLNQTTEYGLNFTLTVKQAFGEPIIVKVASLLDSNVNATLQVDYLKDVTSFTATLNSNLGNAAGKIYVKDTNNTVSVTPTYGVGTVTGAVTDCRTTFTINDFVKTNLGNAFKAGSGTQSYIPKSSMAFDGLTFTIPLKEFFFGGGIQSNAETIVNNFIKKYGCATATGSASNTAGVTSIKYYITYSYGDEYSKTLTYTDTVSWGFRNDNLTEIATISNITLDKTGIVVVP